MMKYERFTWKTEKLQHSDDEVIMVVDNANEDWKGHILNVIDMLNKLNDERMMYKTTIDKRIVELEEENERLRTQLMLCQLSKDGRFRVWEVPPMTIGTTISFSTNGDKK